MERIGEYIVKQLIGEGGMGKVYEAEERLSKRRVALKVLRPELGRSEKGRELFLNEMTILAHFDHPNIVRCLSCSEIDGDLVMALELLEGETLRDRLSRAGRMSWQAAVDVVLQVVAALEVTHGSEPPIIHRDLKPENLMLLEGERVKVMDFGIATALHSISKSTAHSVGTLQYMSPEQIDAKDVDARSDIYCLGLIFYEMLVGRPPFESESPRELLNLQCTSDAPALPDEVRSQLPKGVERMLFAMLAKKPDERPASASEIARSFEPFAVAGTPPQEPAAPLAASGKSEAINNISAASKSPASQPTPASARSDTVALIERASAPRHIPTSWALTLLLVACVATGIATYLVKVSSADSASAESSSAITPLGSR